jgi:tetratricopeptide (TPR) repeat protein
MQQVQLHLDRNEYALARKLLPKILRKRPLSAREKIALCSIYYRLGDLDKALKLAGKEASFDELMGMSEPHIGLQVEVARLLHYIGARYSALRLIDKIEQTLSLRKLQIANINKLYPLFKAIIERIGFYPDRAIESSLKAMEFYEEGSAPFYASWINALDSMLYNDCQEKLGALSRLHADGAMKLRHNYKGIILRNSADQARLRGEHPQALKLINEALAVFPSGSISVEAAVALRVRGEILAETGKKSEAQEDIRQALKIALDHKHSPDMAIKCLLDLELYQLEELSLSEKIALRCHPCYSAYSFYVGKKYDPAKHTFDRTHLKRIQNLNTTLDAWLICDGKISLINYADTITSIRRAAASKNLALVDCLAGVSWSKSHVPTLLPQTKLRALTVLLSAGSLGINLWSAIDSIYAEEAFSFKYGEERLKAMLTELKKLKFRFERRSNFYYAQGLEDKIIILPMEHASPAPWKTFQPCFPEKFQHSDLQDFFHIHKATAYRWMKQWQEDGIIKVKKSGCQFI